MSASNRPILIYLVMDACSSVAAFTLKDEMQTHLRRRPDTFTNPLVCKFGGEERYTPAIITMSRAVAD
jgi:hypothetical protein